MPFAAIYAAPFYARQVAVILHLYQMLRRFWQAAETRFKDDKTARFEPVVALVE